MRRGAGVMPPDAPGDADVFAALPVGVLVVDPANRIARANPAAEQMLNRSERVLTGQPAADFLPHHHSADYASYDTEIRTAEGTRLSVDLTKGEVPGCAGWRTVALHPTGRFNQADGGAGARAAIGAAAMLAHEIRNPLSGIRGAAQLLGSNELTRLIVTEVDRIAGLIDRMQDFGDTRPLACAAANIYPLIAHVLAVARTGFAEGLSIEERFDPSLPPAMINNNALLQVLLNLLKNAREATAHLALPSLTIATAYRHGVTLTGKPGTPGMLLPIEIAVIDNGPGAPSEIVDHLFDPFVSGRPEGQGLGLALVAKLVGDMGGLVRYARENELTVMRVLLPRATA